MDLDLYNDTYDMVCSQLSRGANVLEIGCGPGNISKYLLKERPDLCILGTDAAPAMIDLAQKNNPAAEFRLMDCRDISSLTGKYHAVICGFVAPYLAQQELSVLLNECVKKLHDNGILYISAIEGDYQKSGMEKGSSGNQMQVYYYSEHILQSLFLKSNLDIISTFRKSYDSDTAPIHLIYILKKAHENVRNPTK